MRNLILVFLLFVLSCATLNSVFVHETKCYFTAEQFDSMCKADDLDNDINNWYKLPTRYLLKTYIQFLYNKNDTIYTIVKFDKSHLTIVKKYQE